MTLRGQRLFVRPVTPQDWAAIHRLTGTAAELPREGLVGKLLGDLVSYLSFTTGPDHVRVEEIFVAPDLRRKRVGRVMMAELEDHARRLRCREIVISQGCEATEFFVRLGFSCTDALLRKSISTLTWRRKPHRRGRV